jgi:hypothetical protein
MTNISANTRRFPDPPPFSVGNLFFPCESAIPREIHKAVWGALEMYCDAVIVRNEPWPGWERFERELAFQFATLLFFLRALPKENNRHRVLDLFLDSLNFVNKRGRAHKAKRQLWYFHHGEAMSALWDQELQAVWNMKKSLEVTGAPIAPRLKKAFSEDLVRAVLARKSTPESSLAEVYAGRRHLSRGMARNALREYRKESGKKFAAQT